MKQYTVVFEDTFSFATATRTGVTLTDAQYKRALEQMENKEIVYNKFNKKQHVHEILILKSIKLENK